MNKADARRIADLLGDDEYEVTLEPRVKHFAVITILGGVIWYWLIRLLMWILR